MKKKYKAKRKGFLSITTLLLTLPLAGWWFSESDRTITVAILSIPLILMLWIYFDTSYMIIYNKLFYRSAFLRGHIQIDQIEQVIIGKTMWSGIKPAMARHGLIIKYKFDEIYIAPESNADIVEDLKVINPNIKFIQYNN
jgi:hypothetical protein